MIAPAWAVQERPVNFIFLIDVSGSMLFKTTMVTAADGTKVTLFEALRQALKQVAEDPRLINPKSRISFITFGTKITEKSDWPAKVETTEDRQTLVKMIQSPEALAADKHGDTYMGGALSLALDKANQMYSQTDPCTTTFIVMLTDGWDEPPAGSTIKVRNVAAELSKKQKEMFAKLGVKTWQVLVIGLQRLPEKKAGTTTAKELADLLGGGFIDVSKSAGGTVSERIFLALKNQVEQLKGSLTLGSGQSLKKGIVDFGTVNGNGQAKASFPLELKSCYAEEINGSKDVTSTVPASVAKNMLASAATATGGACRSIATLPPNAITVNLSEPQIVVAPASGDQGNRKATTQEIAVTAQAHSNCPAGHFAGCFKLDSTAKVPDYICWAVRVPGRIIAEPEMIKVKVRKPGFFWPEPTDTELVGKLKELPGSHAQARYDVSMEAGTALMKTNDKAGHPSEATMEKSQFDDGHNKNTLTFALDTSKSDSQEFKMTVLIPATQKPGKYHGELKLNISGPPETVGPTEIPFEITVEPSAWEEIAPVAVPILIILVISMAFGLFLWLTNMKRD